MQDYIKSTNYKIKQLEAEISKSSASYTQKRQMQHTLSKISIFSNDVFEEAIKKNEISANRIELLKEDIECVHMFLDAQNVPHEDECRTLSVVGRIKKLISRYSK